MNDLISTWWIWGIFSVLLAILEMVVPAYIFLGFGIGAAITALVLAIGMAPGLTTTFLIFAIASLIGWLGLRRFFKLPNRETKVYNHDINDN